MRKAVLLIVQMCFIVGIIAASEPKKSPTQDRDNTEDEDAIKFSSDEFPPDFQPSRTDKKIGYDHEVDNNGEIIEINNRNIINPPPRPRCKRCYRLDSQNRCRRIVECVP
ncbi:hypothetical protein TSAR_009595 [Trichomalopsis sarcophagae]|uniref:Uncharacterized protein n=1 Tax=Trichomalopsis sarcophagae TaxID=543379 RepID=A0A232F219_9HYME|nr:hypothetical protein TSAR_009595 [Trichomalopsis sarcophagae]